MSEILRQAARDQRTASDPGASSWVMASAGTGKTKVLTDRVLRLLLAGTAPSKLLCLTFTKAAAAEMADRLAKRLSYWAIVDDDALERALKDLLDAAPEPDMMIRARRLFAQVLDTPDGLRIETIHGFCQILLRRFPLEAGIAPHFQVMDERDAQEAMEESRLRVLDEGRRGGPLAGALAIISARLQEDSFATLLAALAMERGRIERLIRVHGDVDGILAELHRHFGVAPGESADSILNAALTDNAFDSANLRRVLHAMQQGAATDIKRANLMEPWLAVSPADRIAGFTGWCGAFLTAEGTPFARPCTKGVETAMPEAPTILAAEAARLVTLRDKIHAVETLAATGALIQLGVAVLEHYRRYKEARAALDYDDLILRARTLLEDEGRISWVMYKLDQGIDHLLIDEAQDTNPDQWAVIEALTSDFFSGRGLRDEGTRTIFAVGDSKQSIFSFQRADPRAFAEMRERFSQAVRSSEGRWEPVVLTTSFRSVHAVLDAVDRVFAVPEARNGVADDQATIRHFPARTGEGGRVEIWPLIEPLEPDEPPAWAPPVRRIGGDNPSARLARLIAQRIQNMIAEGELLPAVGRPVHAGDFLVLVRRRGAFVEELVRQLKAAGVPVAGADRMVLTEQMAVMDMMALASVLLLPEDDLTLATVLKGPLIGLSEEDLFELAWKRQDTLWAELVKRSNESQFAAAHAYLTGLMAIADLIPPHDLFTRILAGGGKIRLLARLGPDAEDPLDEFLALSLAHERLHTPSLQGFLHWVKQGGDVIKRDFEASGIAVRIMTVHGAKGLEAPIVFLPDSVAVPRSQRKLLWTGARGKELPIWPQRAAAMDSTSLAAKAAAEVTDAQEYRRLLYVAMTRARDRLIVCGWSGARQTEGSWYALVRGALEGSPGVMVRDASLPAELAEGALILSSPHTAAIPEPLPTLSVSKAASLEPWARSLAPAEPVPARPLAPSRPDGEEPPVRSPFNRDDGARFRRGRLIHRLFQSLPGLPLDQRDAAAARFLARRAWALPEPEQADIAGEVARVLTQPDYAPLFGPGSQAEVPLVGLLGGRAIAGQIDRLLVTDTGIQLVDFKSNRPPPTSVKNVAGIYLRQMAAYRGLLAQIYPGHPITCLLLWTDGPTLMSLPDSLLDETARAMGL